MMYKVATVSGKLRYPLILGVKELRLRSVLRPLLIFCLLLCALGSSREYSAEEKLSQLFMVGFRGTTGQDFQNFVAGANWGGYIFYAQDPAGQPVNCLTPTQSLALLQAIQGRDIDIRIKPFLAVDMEGGKMQLARQKTDPVFPFFSSPQQIAAASENSQVQWSQDIARYMATLGFNLNLAPVVDIDRKPLRNSRCFSDQEPQVTALSERFIAEHRAAKVLCALKHFPGRGSGRPKDIAETYNAELDLQPFRALANNDNVGLVMISTLLFPAIDPLQPAYRSVPTHALLRSLGYQKIIITDDISSCNMSEAQLQAEVVELLQAGNDMLLFANNGSNYDPQLSAKLSRIVKRIVREGLVSEEQMEASFQRVLKVKQDHQIEPPEIYLNYEI